MDLDGSNLSDELSEVFAAILGGLPFWVFATFVVFFALYWLFSSEHRVSDCPSPYVCIEATND